MINIRIFFVCFCMISASVVLGVEPENQVKSPTIPPVLLQMIRDDAVQEDLKLSPTQIDSVQKALREVDGDWFRSRNLTDKKQAAINSLTQQLRDSLKKILDSNQFKRLNQLECQALGTRMVTLAFAQEELKLDSKQLRELTQAFVDTDQESSSIRSKQQSQKISEEKANELFSELKKNEYQTVIDLFTDDQRRLIASLTGKPFDFSTVVRSLPLAPLFDMDQAVWIQGKHLQLNELKGKVVAVHFYAFQCINCQRNLPHYNGWHQDYADDGLVVIGIQTPETQAERNVSRVTAALKSDGIQYPVIMDSGSENWKAWGTRMWPSVYLIDKKGFVRNWWYGEMDWEGIEGEKQMRGHIERLLNEDR